MASSNQKTSPKDAQIMNTMLKDMGVTDFEPRVINHMLEFTYRYVTDVLEDARVYSSHACKKELDADDVRLAVQCKLDHSFTTPPPKHLLLDIAKQKNSQALPVIKPYIGPKLPPDRYCLSATNYRLRTLRKPKPATQVISGFHSAQRIASQSSGTPQMITVRSTPVASAPTTPQQQVFRINPSVQGFHSTFMPSGGVKRKLEDDDYDVK